jgi:hypothetical protein
LNREGLSLAEAAYLWEFTAPERREEVLGNKAMPGSTGSGYRCSQNFCKLFSPSFFDKDNVLISKKIAIKKCRNRGAISTGQFTPYMVLI